MRYTAIIAGGRGPDTWDREVSVDAETIRAALDRLEREIAGLDAAVVSIEQED